MFEPREYQQEAVDYGLADKGVPILCAPTGSGKTLIALWIAEDFIRRGKRAVIMTPREEILYQFAKDARIMMGEFGVGLVKAGEPRSPYAPLQICSWPTLRSYAARAVAKKADISMVMPLADVCIVDECHLSVSAQMRQLVLPYFESESKLLGVTATPASKNGQGLGSVYDSIKHVTSVRTLIKEGHLAPLEYFAGTPVELGEVRERSGDYVASDLGRAVMPLIGDYVDEWLRIAKDRHTIVFTPDKASCEGVAERYNQAGITALALHSGKHPEKRHAIVEAFKSQKAQVLVNVGIASYGFDAPSVDCIQLLRNTRSIVLHLQQLGRGMRPFEGKEHCLVLDHTQNTRELGYAADLFRWKLTSGKDAATNWTRDVRSGETKEGEDPKPHECKNCQHLFSQRLDCPKCGLEIIPEKRDLETTDGKLVRISRDRSGKHPEDVDIPERKELYLQLLYIQEKRGYRPTWAAKTYREWNGDKFWPAHAWKDLEAAPPCHAVLNKVNRRIAHFRIKSAARRRKQA